MFNITQDFDRSLPHKIVNGVAVGLTADDLSEIAAKEAHWQDQIRTLNKMIALDQINMIERAHGLPRILRDMIKVNTDITVAAETFVQALDDQITKLAVDAGLRTG